MQAHNNFPKVLVFSHNPFSDSQNNGKTLQSFFVDWPKEKICQLFLTYDAYSTKVCDKFFRITDWEMLLNIIKRKSKVGRSFVGENYDKVPFDDVNKRKKNILMNIGRFMGINRISLGLLFKDWIWKNACENKSLQDWITEQKPNVLFFLSGGAVSSFNLAEKICQKYNLPMIMQTTDDYISKKFSLDPFFHVYINRINKAYKNAVEYSSCIIAIGDKMAFEYKNKFGGNYIIAMNSVSIQKENYIQKIKENMDSPIRMIFAGNLGIGRWKILKNLAKSIELIDKIHGIRCELKIYSLSCPNKKILKGLNNGIYSQFCGALAQEELKKVQCNSNMLVHVEAFDHKNKYITRLSISTKIPEYMNSGKCILAIGPKEVASMSYLYDNNSAAVIFNKDVKSISNSLIDILSDTAKIELYRENSYKLVCKNHDIEKIKSMIYEEITTAYNKSVID